MDEDRFFNGRIVELDWCAFDVKKQQVVDDVQNFIKPSDGFILTQDQIVSTGITQDNLTEGSTLASVLKKFIDSCFYNYASKNRSFCLVTFGDMLLTKIRGLAGVESVEQQADRVAIRMRASETGTEVLLDDMMRAGCRIRMFQPEAMDMETAFMKLTEGKTA